MQALLDLLAPARCPACDHAPGPTLCPACYDALVPVAHPCTRCGAPRSSATATCGTCLDAGWPHLHAVTVRWAYRDRIAALIGDCKAAEDLPAGRALARLLPATPEEVDLVVPVPPSPGRRGGPHLATLLARHAARRIERPLRRLLRTRALAAEQHRLSASERQRNVSDLFHCPKPCSGSILLVDDILTSGATARAAAAALRTAGARRVELLALARTPRSDDDGPDEPAARRLSAGAAGP